MGTERQALSGIGVAVLSVVTTLLGALIGAGVTFAVFALQADAQIAAEERAERREAYTEYSAAAVALLQAQIDLVSDWEGNCLTQATYQEAPESPVCVVWSSAPVSDPLLRWTNSWDQLRVYGSENALEIGTRINELITPVNRNLMPYATAVVPFAVKDVPVDSLSEYLDETSASLKPFEDAVEEFTFQACYDTSLAPERCDASFSPVD
ncbi:hypothetical protein ACPW96_22965 [Micromonospora sp. DT81.3]|uniref:hypothetical protein n=1 Tax=Micromonospora sp. DT81.3 TaxID=3416523 RepID=UPI003CE67BC6